MAISSGNHTILAGKSCELALFLWHIVQRSRLYIPFRLKAKTRHFPQSDFTNLVAKWAMETKCAIASGVRCTFVKHKLLALILVAPRPLIELLSHEAVETTKLAKGISIHTQRMRNCGSKIQSRQPLRCGQAAQRRITERVCWRVGDGEETPLKFEQSLSLSRLSVSWSEGL
jgi:hypothetical protein